MFRDMRRNNQQLSQEECEAILKNATAGVLSLLGDDGYPYGVPLSHAYADGKLYFHGAKVGHKIDAIRNCAKASFCVIDRDDVKDTELTTYFRSVIAFGKVELLEGEEMLPAVNLLARRFFPAISQGWEARYQSSLNSMYMLVLTVEHLTGKQAVELAKARNQNH